MVHRYVGPYCAPEGTRTVCGISLAKRAAGPQGPQGPSGWLENGDVAWSSSGDARWHAWLTGAYGARGGPCPKCFDVAT